MIDRVDLPLEELNRKDLQLDIIAAAKAFVNTRGFKPTTITATKAFLMELYRAYDYNNGGPANRSDRDILEKYIHNPPNILGLGVVVSDDIEGPFVLTRESKSFVGIRNKSMEEVYQPAADITNSLADVLRAALVMSQGTKDDACLGAFAKDLGAFSDAPKRAKTWERDALPDLQMLCEHIEDTDIELTVYKNFFTAMMDFYWHCSKAVPTGTPRQDMKNLQDAMHIAAVVRKMPKQMQKDFMDHLASIGSLPDVLTSK